ncbi:MAG TPA: hypothetical protein GX525_09065, partial [Bacilli bacterium]|nr:hypothetical protein [Bacilli bacterium]
QEETVTQKLVDYKIREVNYLIYNVPEGDQYQHLTLSFPYKIEELNIKKVSLFQDETMVQADPRIIYINENELAIEMTEYIPEFNKIIATLDNNQTVILDTGQYYFEEFEEYDYEEENMSSVSIESLHSQFWSGELVITTVFRNEDESEIEFKLPNRIEKYISNLNFEKVNSEQYVLTATISKDLLLDQKVDLAAIDLGFVENNKGRKRFILKIRETIQLSEYPSFN